MAPPPASDPAGSNLRPWEPIRSLAEEFRYNAGIVDKVGQLERQGYSGWRRVRGDGNCFYRALGFGLLELIVTSKSPRRADWAAALLQRLAALRLPDAAERAAHAALLACLRGLFSAAGLPPRAQREPLDPLAGSAPGDLLDVMSNPCRPEDLALVRALRVLVAQYITEHAHDDSLNGGISFQLIAESLGYPGAEGFCSSVVLALGVEAEDMILPAVPGALGVGLRVALLHRSSGSDLVFCDYGPGADECESAGPVVHLQLRPGHYDLLYPDAWAPASSSGAPVRPPPPARQEQARGPPRGEPPARGAALSESPRGHGRRGPCTLPATSAPLPREAPAPSSRSWPPATSPALRPLATSAAPGPPAPAAAPRRGGAAVAALGPPATSASAAQGREPEHEAAVAPPPVLTSSPPRWAAPTVPPPPALRTRPRTSADLAALPGPWPQRKLQAEATTGGLVVPGTQQNL